MPENEKINFVEGNVDYATDMPVWLLILLNIVTLSFYSCYWAVVNIRMLNHIKKSDVWPWVGIFFGIPVVPYYIFYKILELNYPNRKLLCHAIALFLLVACYAPLPYGYKEFPISTLVLLTFLPQAIIQHQINKFIKKHRI